MWFKRSTTTYSKRGTFKGFKRGFSSFMVHVTITPASAQTAGTRPNPYLETEKHEQNGLQSFRAAEVSAKWTPLSPTYPELGLFALYAEAIDFIFKIVTYFDMTRVPIMQSHTTPCRGNLRIHTQTHILWHLRRLDSFACLLQWPMVLYTIVNVVKRTTQICCM